METFKTFGIFKIPSRDCLKPSNINWKAFSEKLITKDTLYKTFPRLSQKTVPTLLLKNVQITEKCHFQMLGTFFFYLKAVSKPFSEIPSMTKFGFK